MFLFPTVPSRSWSCSVIAIPQCDCDPDPTVWSWSQSRSQSRIMIAIFPSTIVRFRCLRSPIRLLASPKILLYVHVQSGCHPIVVLLLPCYPRRNNLSSIASSPLLPNKSVFVYISFSRLSWSTKGIESIPSIVYCIDITHACRCRSHIRIVKNHPFQVAWLSI